MKTTEHFYSVADHLPSVLEMNSSEELGTLLDNSLLTPVKIFFENPGKNIRPKLVELGFRLAADREDEEVVEANRVRLSIASSIVESIHAGALIVDDIQDASEVRRELPTLHLKYGIPKALNAGNWLYFWGLGKIKELKLNSSIETSLIYDCLDLMMKAHMGQALDIGTSIDTIPKENIKDVCLASMELKTGTLLSLALKMGAALNNISPERNQKLESLGARLGVALQMFDDAGNFLLPKSAGPSKRHEDLRLRRPTWVWAYAASLSDQAYRDFIVAVIDLPSEEKLDMWIDQYQIREGLLLSAKEYLGSIINDFSEDWSIHHPFSTQQILNLARQLENSYVK